MQIGVSSVNWLLIAGVLFLLLQREIPYHTVLATLLVAAIAGVLTHVPAGLGVLEAVFVTLLSSKMATSGLLAALLAYRGHLLPGATGHRCRRLPVPRSADLQHACMTV